MAERPTTAALLAPPLADFRPEDGHLRDCCGCCADCECTRLLYARTSAMQEWLTRAWPYAEHRPPDVEALFGVITNVTQGASDV